MGIISWLILGAIAGWLAGKIMGSRFSLMGNVILGVAGAIAGGFVTELVTGGAGITGLNLGSIVVAVLGSCGTLYVARFFGGNKQLPR